MASPSSSQPLVALAEQLLASAKTITAYLEANSLPQPSFSASGPLEFPPAGAPPEIIGAQVAIKNAAKTLGDLVAGPHASLLWLNIAYVDCMSTEYIVHCHIPEAVPLEGDVSYEEIAAKAGVSERHLKPMLRLAFLNNLFCETRPGYVAHTAASSLLLRNRPIRKLTEYATADCFPAAARTVDAIKKWGRSEEPTHSGFQLAHNTDLSPFEFWGRNHPERLGRFSEAMDCLTADQGYNASHIVKGYEWASLGQATVVDVGGSKGHISVALAKAYPSLSLLVQDLPHNTAIGESQLPPDLQSKVTFQPHDFFNPQPPLPDAFPSLSSSSTTTTTTTTTEDGTTTTIYFLRFILHDWPDAYAKRILQALIPSLEANPKTTRIVIAESVLPPTGVLPASEERLVRFMDLQMMLFLNAKEREMADWMALFKEADPRLKVTNVTRPEGSVMSLMELVLEV